jgi:hypothetical protein
MRRIVGMPDEIIANIISFNVCHRQEVMIWAAKLANKYIPTMSHNNKFVKNETIVVVNIYKKRTKMMRKNGATWKIYNRREQLDFTTENIEFINHTDNEYAVDLRDWYALNYIRFRGGPFIVHYDLLSYMRGDTRIYLMEQIFKHSNVTTIQRDVDDTDEFIEIEGNRVGMQGAKSVRLKLNRQLVRSATRTKSHRIV